MRFQFVADMVFEADDIDDAFRKLQNHFGSLQVSDDVPSIMLEGFMTIDPIDKKCKKDHKPNLKLVE